MKNNMFDNFLSIKFMEKYKDMSLKGVKDIFKREGPGELIDFVDNNQALYEEFIEKYRNELAEYTEEYHGSSGVVDSGHQDVKGVTLSLESAFKFNNDACLTKCDGRCCKKRGYLMLGFKDIFNILSSPAAVKLGIRNTMDLFEKNPPLIDIFFDNKYGLHLPFIRFLPLGYTPTTRPEHAKSNICPFLYPVKEVFEFHDILLPEKTNHKAMACILMDNKPMICRLSPIGQSCGMITGKYSYEYAKPSSCCPACNTDVEITLSNYLSAIIGSPFQIAERGLFQTMLVEHHFRQNKQLNQKRFDKVLREFYNFNGLISSYGYDHNIRPEYSQLMYILIYAAKGDYRPYKSFIHKMEQFQNRRGKNLPAIKPKPTKKMNGVIPLFLYEIRMQLNKFRYTILPFIENVSDVIIHGRVFYLVNYYNWPWKEQPINMAAGTCRHLTTILKNFLIGLECNNKKFIDYFDIFFASNVVEDNYFNIEEFNHICLLITLKGERERGWLIDPSLNYMSLFNLSSVDPVCYRPGNKFFITNKKPCYTLPANFGSSIRDRLDILDFKQKDLMEGVDNIFPICLEKGSKAMIYGQFILNLNDYDNVTKINGFHLFRQEIGQRLDFNTPITEGSGQFQQLMELYREVMLLNDFDPIFKILEGAPPA